MMEKNLIEVVITAGGTIENIDDVRSIANTSTGKLGSLICDAFIEAFEKAHKPYCIHYIVSKTAVRPEGNDHVVFYEVSNTLSVEKTVKEVLSANNVSIFVHSMAISDFMVSSAVNIQDVAKEISEVVINDRENVQETIEQILRSSRYEHNRNHKISSKDDLVLILEQTPKIISIVKQMQPNIFLVGFKLLNDVSEQRLVEVATVLGQHNKCDFVLANDLKSIQNGLHQGLVVKDGDILERFDGKEKIAKGIVARCISEM